MACRDLVLLTPLLMEQECPLVVAEPVVLDVHGDERADAAECVERIRCSHGDHSERRAPGR